jgi:ATP-dependent Lhr-like helicase
MQIGTIVSDASVTVQYVGGGKLGTVEEGFAARLRPGDRFLFAGKTLEFVRIKDMAVQVRRASSLEGAVPRWAGGRLPLSSELSQAIRETLGEAKEGELNSPELRLLAGLLEIQARWSAIPGPDELLIEQVEDRDGFHVFVYPFEGRLVHEGMAALLAFRMGRLHRLTLSMACNDYGFELLAPGRFPVEESFEEGILGEENLLDDIVASLNSTEMAKRQFREIARIAGLVFTGYPGQAKRAKQVQATSGLFFDVFERYDPGNLLLRQAKEEVLERQLEQSRMAAALSRLRRCKRVFTRPPRPTPLSFPILVDRLRETMSSESVRDRIERMALRLEKAADADSSAFRVAQ